MTKRILIMGLPGSGKTYLAENLKKHLEKYYKSFSVDSIIPFTDSKIKVGWLNADDVRKKYDDWDFSIEGRIRQSHRMRELADSMTDADYVICDFVAPLVEMRNNFKADWTIWVDTIPEGRFADTNRLFVPPETYDFRVTEQDSERWAKMIVSQIIR